MQTMQDRVLAALANAITELGLEPVAHPDWANTGALYGQDGLATLIKITYNFQQAGCSLTMEVPGLDTTLAGIGDSPAFRVENDVLRFAQIDYADGDRLMGAVMVLSGLVEAFRHQANGE